MLNRKKEAIEKEKSLLDERVNARRDAEDTLSTMEQKAELERQLAMVEMDSTRSKDAAALREQIDELNKEITRKTEDDLLASQQKILDDEIAAIDDTITSGQEELEVFLNDANNFSEELNKVLAMSQEELLDWMSENVEQFTISTQATQQQMLNGWIDTYKQYKNIVNMYEDEITEIINTKDTFLEFMSRTNQDYLNGDETKQQSLLYQWSELYDAYINAYKDDNIEWSHYDDADVVDQNSSIDDNTQAILDNTISVNTLSENLTKIIDALTTFSLGGQYYGYASGGLVEHTGLAWLDGTKQNPEYVLSSSQWKDISSLIDMIDYSFTPETMRYNNYSDASNVSMSNYITINEATISDSVDIAELAEEIGKQFTASLSLNGFNTRFNI